MLAEKLYQAQQSKPVPEILVIGDLMLDHYILGQASRLSPEAPVPIVNVKKETKIIGGAANVASNLITLGARVSLAGITGKDTAGEEIRTILRDKNIDTRLIAGDESRSTTVKTRVIAGNHHIVRIDHEDVHEIPDSLEHRFLSSLLPAIAGSDIVILSDYNKGLLTPTLCLDIISHCRQLSKKVIVDPKGLDYSKYEGAYLIKPNRKELAEAAKAEKINSLEELTAAASVIFKITGAAYLIVTLSEDGIAILTTAYCEVLPVMATEVYDVTGAGDTVIATLAYCTALGFSITEACTIANYAASIVIRHIGSATTTTEEIIKAIKNK